MSARVVHPQVHEVVVLLAGPCPRGRRRRRSPPAGRSPRRRLQEILHRGATDAAAGEPSVARRARAQTGRRPTATPTSERGEQNPASRELHELGIGLLPLREVLVHVEQRAEMATRPSADRRQGTRSGVAGPGRAAGRPARTPPRPAALRASGPTASSAASTKAPAIPSPARALAALLLRQRHAGPESERGSSRPARSRSRAGRAGARRRRARRRRRRACGTPRSAPPPARPRREAQRQPAVDARSRSEQEQRGEHGRVERPASGGDERLVVRLRPRRGEPATTARGRRAPATASSGPGAASRPSRPPRPRASASHPDGDRPPDREVVEAVGDRAHAGAESEQGEERQPRPSPGRRARSGRPDPGGDAARMTAVLWLGRRARLSHACTPDRPASCGLVYVSSPRLTSSPRPLRRIVVEANQPSV